LGYNWIILKKELEMETISKTDALLKIIGSKGRFFTVMWKTIGGKETRFNAKFHSRKDDFRRKVNKIFGYFELTGSSSKLIKLLNSRGIKELHIDKQTYKIK